jgi:hypothetical protein
VINDLDAIVARATEADLIGDLDYSIESSEGCRQYRSCNPEPTDPQRKSKR